MYHRYHRSLAEIATLLTLKNAQAAACGRACPIAQLVLTRVETVLNTCSRISVDDVNQ